MKKTLPFIIPVFRSVLFVLGGFLLSVVTSQNLEQASRWWSVLFTIFNLITILILLLIFKYEGTTFQKIINYKKQTTGIGYIIIVVILMIIIGIGGLIGFGFLIYGSLPNMLVKPIPVWVASINIILLPITVVFAELPLYFGYSLKRIEKITGNTYFAIAYTVFFFALQHSFIPLLLDWKYIIFRFISFLPLMIVIGILYNKRRNLIPLMVGHGILDLATSIQILIVSISPTIFDAIQ